MSNKPLATHQKVSLKFMKNKNRVFDMSDPGTMKTRVEIEDFRRNRDRRSMLVLAPKSILVNAWGNDITEFAPELTYSVAYAENREEAFEQKADIYITNLDAANYLAQQKHDFFKKFGRIVVDESSAFKHHTSGRSRSLNKIKEYFDIRRAMSGSPNTRSITDIWNQAYFLDDGKRLGKQFYAFRNSVAVPEQVGRKAEMVKWHDKPGAEEAVADLLRDITVRHVFDECVDIPKTHWRKLFYDVTKKQRRTYEDMKDDAIVTTDDGRVVVAAVNAASVRTKMLQILSGAVYSSPNEYHLLDSGRYELVVDLVEERKHSIVFYLWKHQRDEIIRQAKKRGIQFCVMDGDTSNAQRIQLEKLFQAGFFQMMLCHPKSTAHGLTLTKATATIWPSPPDDLEWWVQGNRRHARKGQEFKTEVIAILVDDTIEMGVYANLLAKRGRMDNLLELLGYK